MENKTRRSYLRTQSLAANGSKVMLKQIITNLAPGAPMIWDVIEALLGYGQRYYNDRKEQRLEEFHKRLVNTCLKGDKKNIEEFLEQELDLNDYHALLNACVSDIENEKTELYANLMAALISYNYSPQISRHFILSMNQLSYHDLDFIRRLYIYAQFDVMSHRGQARPQSLLKSQEPLTKVLIAKLDAMAFLDEAHRGLSSLGERFAKAIFTDTGLTAEAIGERTWLHKSCMIATYELDGDHHSLVADKLRKVFEHSRIRSSVGQIQPRWEIGLFSDQLGVLLVGDRVIEAKFEQALSEFSKTSSMIRIDLTPGAKDQTLDQVQFIDHLSCLSTDPAEIAVFAKQHFQSDNLSD
ncbi:hypothetical protein [Photobacterium nomapromontoriensis]|uniref:hypothetical protein n=1 Tax=Photobacterium nomapromontoriensis TaxID=2910237 RepID=UPI003D0DB1E7